MYINDLDEKIQAADDHIYIVKFADDTKIGREIVDIQDSYKLQAGIDNLVQWCREWGMALHPDKCVVLHFGHKNPRRCAA